MNKIVAIMVMVACVFNGGSVSAADYALDAQIKRFLDGNEGSANAGYTKGHTKGYEYCSDQENRDWLYKHMKIKNTKNMLRQASLGTPTVGKESLTGMVLDYQLVGETSPSEYLRITEIYERLIPGKFYHTIEKKSVAGTWHENSAKARDKAGSREEPMPLETTTTYSRLTTLGKCCVVGAVAGLALAWKHKEAITKLLSSAQKVNVLAR